MARKKAMRAIILFFGLALSACGTFRLESRTSQNSAARSSSSSFCDVAKQMTWAARDSLQTQDEIRSFNALVRKHCSPEGSPNGK